MKKNKVWMIVGCVLVVVCIFSGVAYAQPGKIEDPPPPINEDLKLVNEDLPGRAGIKAFTDNGALHGAFKTEELLDSNIYMQNTDTIVDSITVLSPSVGLEVPFHNGSISADYQADIFEYGVHHTEDHVDQRLRGLAEMEFADFYTVTVNDIFRIFTDRASTEDSIRLKQKVNDIRAGILAVFNRLALDAGYTNLLEINDSTDPYVGQVTYQDRDRDSNIIDTSVSYRFLPKTSAVLENDLGFVHYYNSSLPPDSWYDEALFGFKGEWFAKANINFKAGLKCQQYDTSTVIADKGYVGPVMRGGFDYSPNANDTLVFEFDREIYESLYSNMNYYNANLFGFKWRHNFTPKIYSRVFASYQLHLYPSDSTENGVTAKRQDNYYEAGVGVKYDIRKWVSVEVKYQFLDRTSNFDVFNYVDNQVMVNGTIGF